MTLSRWIAVLALTVASLACSSAAKKETAAPQAAAPAAAPAAAATAPATPACASDGDCQKTMGPCAKCNAGVCAQSFGPQCCDRNEDCGNPNLRCRGNVCK